MLQLQIWTRLKSSFRKQTPVKHKPSRTSTQLKLQKIKAHLSLLLHLFFPFFMFLQLLFLPAEQRRTRKKFYAPGWCVSNKHENFTRISLIWFIYMVSASVLRSFCLASHHYDPISAVLNYFHRRATYNVSVQQNGLMQVWCVIMIQRDIERGKR